MSKTTTLLFCVIDDDVIIIAQHQRTVEPRLGIVYGLAEEILTDEIFRIVRLGVIREGEATAKTRVDLYSLHIAVSLTIEQLEADTTPDAL